MKAIPYVPKIRVRPDRVLNIGSAWIGIESILFSLIKEFDVRTHVAVEFGVDEGYSLAALANYFGEVLGVDHMAGLGHDPDVIYPQLLETFKGFPNVRLLQASWEQFAKDYYALEIESTIDLIHIDMDHNYEQTFAAGEWAVQHAPITIWHDTTSWPDGVGRACEDLADKYGLHYYNFEDCHGLGILSRKGLVK